MEIENYDMTYVVRDMLKGDISRISIHVTSFVYGCSLHWSVLRTFDLTMRTPLFWSIVCPLLGSVTNIFVSSCC